MLQNLRVELKITVVDADAGKPTFDHWIGGGHGDGTLPVPEGFPPTTLYEISDDARGSHVVLGPGRYPIYWTRQVHRRARIGVGSSRTAIDRDEWRLDWLASLLDTRRELLELRPTTHRTLHWKDPDRYIADVEEARDRIAEDWDRTVAQLVEKRLLTEAQAAEHQPAVKIVVSDRRTKGTTPLPALPDSDDRREKRPAVGS